MAKEQAKPQQLDKDKDKITFDIFCDVKGVTDSQRFAMSKLYPQQSYTYTEWEKIMIKDKL